MTLIPFFPQRILTEPPVHTKKHLMNADTSTKNHLLLTNINTENGTTYSGTTLHSAKMSAPTSDTDSLSYLQKFLNGLLICLKKRTYPFNVLRKTLNCLFITLLGAVWSIILTFAWYSPVLEMQNDFIWFWSYLFRDHRKQVIIAS